MYRRPGIVRNTPDWTAPGRRDRGMPRETWLRTMRREAGDECWGDIEELAQDRMWWHEFTEALCIPEGATGCDWLIDFICPKYPCYNITQGLGTKRTDFIVTE